MKSRGFLNFACGLTTIFIVLYNVARSFEDQTSLNTKDFNANKFKRDVLKNTFIREPYNSNDQSRFIEVVFVVDNRIYQELNNSTDQVEKYCKDIVNVVNGIYSSLNIFVFLSDVVIWKERDEIETTEDGAFTLKQFLDYRRGHLLLKHPNDFSQLITKQKFANGVVGKVLNRVICSTDYSGGVVSDVSTEISLMGTAVAHNLAHTLGVLHDTPNCTCAESKCIMSTSYSLIPLTQWSSCSRNAIKLSFATGLDHCLKNTPRAIFRGSVCGNGFVEDDEQCDCGLPEFCDNKCCNATTCLLNEDAKCATGKCCDLQSCSLKLPGLVCRTAANECDLPEYCTGTSEHCPGNFYKLDGEICGNGIGYCFKGQCGTHSHQCKLLWGKYSHTGLEKCFDHNVKGTRFGNCGYDFITKSYSKCDQEDILCGRLHCQHANDALQYGMESTAIVSQSFIESNGSILPCRHVTVDFGPDSVDLGLVPDGANCGPEKMCVKQKCVSVASVQENRTCPNNCYNNGYCNNLGHCHCDVGYVLPDCRFVAPGGSVDSGPAYLYPTNNLL